MAVPIEPIQPAVTSVALETPVVVPPWILAGTRAGTCVNTLLYPLMFVVLRKELNATNSD